MKKFNIKSVKKVTKTAAPIERTIKWDVGITAENIEFLSEFSDAQSLVIGESIELEGQVFIKSLNFIEQQEVSKAYKFDVKDLDEVAQPKLKEVNSNQIVAAQLLGSICEDEKGTPFFKDLNDVYASDPRFINALYNEADKVNNFLGKLKKKNLTETNSSVNSSSTESVVKPLKKPK